MILEAILNTLWIVILTFIIVANLSSCSTQFKYDSVYCVPVRYQDSLYKENRASGGACGVVFEIGE